MPDDSPPPNHAPSNLLDLDNYGNEYRAAVNEIVSRLEGMREAAADERARRTSWNGGLHLDTKRSSKVLLIDGPRGSGKTTLLLKVLCEISSPRDENTRGGLFPAQLIDLETLSSSVPLPFHVLASLRSVADTKRDSESAAYDLDSDLETSWSQLHQALGRGWRNNLRFKSKTMEPTDYTWALETAARGNTEHTRAFREFMDSVSNIYSRRVPSGQQPLFVIVIDDADMHPDRSADLIHLVRSFWHPNLAFLIAGDVGMLLEGLALDYADRLSPQHARGDRTVPQRIAGQDPRHLALEALDKSIPGDHRLTVKPWDAAKRLEWLTQQLSDRSATLQPALAQIFALGPNLAHAIPPHHRERNEFVDSLIREASQANMRARSIGIDAMANRAWANAVQRDEVPTEALSVLGLARDASPVFGNPRATIHDLSSFRGYVGTPTFRVRNPSTASIPIDSNGTLRTWPASSSTRSGAAFRLLAFVCADHVVPEGYWEDEDGGLVWTRIPARYVDLLGPSQDAPSAWIELAMLGIDKYQLATLAFRTQVVARVSRRDAWDSLVDLLRVLTPSSGPLFPAGESTDQLWSRLVDDINNHPQRAASSIITGILAACPESGLDAAHSNRLFREITSALEARHTKQAMESARTLRLDRARLALQLAMSQQSQAAMFGRRIATAESWIDRIDAISGDFDVANELSSGIQPSRTSSELQEFTQILPTQQIETDITSHWKSSNRHGLGAYFTDARVTRLLDAKNGTPDDRIHSLRLEEELANQRKLNHGRGSEYVELRSLWQAVDAPTWGAGRGASIARFRSHEVRLTQHEDLFPRYQRGHSSRVVQGAPELSIKILDLRLSDPVGPNGPVPMTVPQRVILSIIRDVDRDARDVQLTPPWTLDQWPVLVHNLQFSLRSTWPGVRLIAPIDDEALLTSWNSLFSELDAIETGYSTDDRTVDAQDEPDQEDRQVLIDDIAVAYIQMAFYVGQSRHASTSYQHDYRSVENKLRGIHFPEKGLLSTTGARTEAFGMFVNYGIPVLCLPERGLTEVASAAIFDWWQKECRRTQRVAECAQVWTTRITGLIDASTGEAFDEGKERELRAKLENIDQEHMNWPAVAWLHADRNA